MVDNRRPGFAFLLPWSYDVEGGGVGHAVAGLADQCLAESVYRPIALEIDWESKRPKADDWRGLTRVRLCLRPPWSDKRVIRTAISYLLHLPLDLHRFWRVIQEYNLRVINRQFPGLDSFTLVLMRRIGLFH